MQPSTRHVLFWAPRVLGILFAALVSLFALDVFGEGYGFRDTIVALVMHLVPAMIVLTLLVIAWHREAVGGTLFIALGLWCWIAPGGPKALVIFGPLLLLGVLFLTDGAYRAKVRSHF